MEKKDCLYYLRNFKNANKTRKIDVRSDKKKLFFFFLFLYWIVTSCDTKSRNGHKLIPFNLLFMHNSSHNPYMYIKNLRRFFYTLSNYRMIDRVKFRSKYRILF